MRKRYIKTEMEIDRLGDYGDVITESLGGVNPGGDAFDCDQPESGYVCTGDDPLDQLEAP